MNIIDVVLENLGGLLSTVTVLTPLIVLAAGVLTSFTPCTLSSLPLVVGYIEMVMKLDKDVSKAKLARIAGLFTLGQALTYTVMGILASVLGKLINFGSSAGLFVLGVLMLVLALQNAGVISVFSGLRLNIPPAKLSKYGYLGAVLVGIMSSLIGTPCSTPVLIALLGLIASQGSLLLGALLLFVYSIGRCVLFVLALYTVSTVERMRDSKSYKFYSKLLMWAWTVCLTLLGVYLIYTALL